MKPYIKASGKRELVQLVTEQAKIRSPPVVFVNSATTRHREFKKFFFLLIFVFFFFKAPAEVTLNSESIARERLFNS